jgi:hypothetical protein
VALKQERFCPSGASGILTGAGGWGEDSIRKTPLEAAIFRVAFLSPSPPAEKAHRSAKIRAGQSCIMTPRRRETFPPVTLGHIRGHGCRDLLVYCECAWCNHSAVINADWLRDEMPLRSLCNASTRPQHSQRII